MTVETFNDIGACVFDAYGTLFDVNAAAAHCQEDLGDNWQPLAEMWRLKQLQYTWLRGLMGRHTDFWQVTGDALDYAMESLGLEDTPLRQRLMELYLALDAYPEVKGVLTKLKSAGLKTAILSNGAPKMLEAAVNNAGISDLLDAILSVEDVGVFKPHPSVYQMGVDRARIAGRQNVVPILQRLGCRRRVRIRLPGRLDQSIRTGARAHSRAPSR